MSNIKKILIFLSIILIAITASAQYSKKIKYYPQFFYFTLFTPNSSYKILDVSTPNPLWIHGQEPTCSYNACTYGIMDGIIGYEFAVTVGTDPQHECQIIVKTSPYSPTKDTISLLANSSCDGDLTYQPLENVGWGLIINIYQQTTTTKK